METLNGYYEFKVQYCFFLMIPIIVNCFIFEKINYP